MSLFFRHSEELIKRLEQAGLGYHVDADKTTDKLGNHAITSQLPFKKRKTVEDMSARHIPHQIWHKFIKYSKAKYEFAYLQYIFKRKNCLHIQWCLTLSQ